MNAAAATGRRAGAHVAAEADVSAFDIHLLGVNNTNLHRLLLSLLAVGALVLARYVIVWLVRLTTGQEPNERVVFWTRQGVSLGTTILIALLLASIWFDNSQRLGTFAGLVAAGIAFAMQKVVTAFAGYLVILRGKTFTVGDRITMGGVRGDVIALGFLQTRIMEMGEPPDAQSGDNASWVHARQYTGRVVTVTNDKVFDTPIYNYTREFPFMWEEIRIPIAYGSNRQRAEQILVECAGEVTEPIERVGDDVKRAMEKKYFIDLNALKPRVFYTLTDNWVELNLRFLSRPHGARNLKDEISRTILDRFEKEKIGIASGTYDVVGFPPLKLEGPLLERMTRALEERVDSHESQVESQPTRDSSTRDSRLVTR
jgi:small-conductance mechanosensitive channel